MKRNDRSSSFFYAGRLKQPVMNWRPKDSQFYSRHLNIPGEGNYPRACVVLHSEDNEMSRNSETASHKEI
jgi:hypothetical protein